MLSILGSCYVEGTSTLQIGTSDGQPGMSWKLSIPPDATPLQDVLHAAGHGGIAADLQGVARAHGQDQVVIKQSRLHAHACHVCWRMTSYVVDCCCTVWTHKGWRVILMLEEVGYRKGLSNAEPKVALAPYFGICMAVLGYGLHVMRAWGHLGVCSHASSSQRSAALPWPSACGLAHSF